MRLIEMEMECFRAFGRPQVLNFRADTVLLVGRNGFGKSTIYDAISWCFFGSSRRFGGTRDFGRSDSYLVNAFRQSSRPRVRIQLSTVDGEVTAERSGTSLILREGAATIDGPEAQERLLSLMGFSRDAEEESTAFIRRTRDSFSRTFLLHQDLLASFITSDSPRSRFDAFAELFSLTPVRDFYTHLVEERGTARSRRITAQHELELREAQLSQIQRQLQSEEETAMAIATGLGTDVSNPEDRAAELLDQLHRILPNAARPVGRVSEQLASAIAQISREVSSYEQQIRSLQELEQQLPLLSGWQQRIVALEASFQESATTLGDKEKELGDSNTRLANLRQELQRVEGTLSSFEATREQFARLLREALEFVTSDVCPICSQPISRDSLRAHIEERLSAEDPYLNQLTNERSQLIRELRESEEVTRALSSELSSLQRERQVVAIQQQDIERNIQSFSERSITIVGVDITNLTLEVMSSRLEVLRHQIANLSEVRGAMVALSPFLEAIDTRQRLQDLRSENAVQSGFASTYRRQVAEFDRAERELDELVSASRRAERTIVESLVERFREPIRQAFRWLSPHPLFQELDFRFGEFDQAGELYFEVKHGDYSLNPATSFSSAQANALALAVFLTLNAAQTWSPIEFALIDDPVQQMDSVNILSLVDLLRAINQERQLVLSTSNPYLHDLVADKLRPSSETARLLTHRFEALSEEGPAIETEALEYSSAEPVLPKVLRLSA